LAQTRRGDFAAGGDKNHKGGTFFIYNIGCMQQPGGKTSKWGGRATLATQLTTALCWSLSNDEMQSQRLDWLQNNFDKLESAVF